MHDSDIVIIGGGISGSAALHFLSRSGANALLIDESERLGGVIRSERHPSMGVIERGPNTLQSTSGALGELMGDLGLAEEIIEADASARNRFVVKNGQLVSVPTNPKEAIETGLLSFSGKLRLLTEFVRPRRDNAHESVAHFVRRRFGTEVLAYGFDPLVSGIYAGDTEKLAIDEVFPSLANLESEYGSVLRGAIARLKTRRSSPRPRKSRSLFTFERGLEHLCDSILKAWPNQVCMSRRVTNVLREQKGWRIELADGEEVSCRRVILAVGAPAAADLWDDLDSETSIALRSIEYAPIAVVSMSWPRRNVSGRTDGFGALVPSSEGRDILGVIFNSSIFPGRVGSDRFVCTAFVGGARKSQLLDRTDEAIGELAEEEVRSLLDISTSSDSRLVTVWRPGIAQNAIGHRETVRTIDKRLETLGCAHAIGSYHSGVSIPQCVERAKAVAEQILNDDSNITHAGET